MQTREAEDPEIRHFRDEQPDSLPLSFEYGEEHENGDERQYGCESDILTDEKYSDTD
ncbi:MAG: hypothetical protein UU84_C0023G0009 [Candidatus Yanofskybacteria bacterium GW2011_GWC2_41_9]|uniref:Uncharacterized protein n=1 Tax=Candidatus Yanofskybacteria bacterium GW2011_GWC2_41_9 TaxID=1619029 RepID=A0A0G0XP61_9BACT|nr:MAG: hypothetical protein UU84_C0023G0009 [Candidatus Yanofskybacteria bacterium GW2011_GWC2_41_9]